MCKKLILIAALLGLAMLLVLPLAVSPAKGPTPPVPWGPGRIALNDRNWIVMVNADGTGRTVVAPTEYAGEKFWGPSIPPAWSPVFSDGKVRLAYHHFDYSDLETYLLMVVDPFADVPTPAPVEGLTVPHGIFDLDWSPSELLGDGTERVRVAFETWLYWGTAELRMGIYIVDLNYHPDPTNPKSRTFTAGSYDADGVFTPGMNPLVVDPGPGGDYYRAPRFSPDGQWLTISRLPRNSQPSIWLVNATNPAIAMPLPNQPAASNKSPAWWQAHDEETGDPVGPWWLAFMSNQSGRYEIHIAQLDLTSGTPVIDTDTVRRVTNSSNVDEDHPTWSPDGTQIAYHASGKPNVGKIGRVIVATGQQYDVTTGQYPDWSPPGVPPLP